MKSRTGFSSTRPWIRALVPSGVSGTKSSAMESGWDDLAPVIFPWLRKAAGGVVKALADEQRAMAARLTRMERTMLKSVGSCDSGDINE